jgi:CheY-like chemotaxis protein
MQTDPAAGNQDTPADTPDAAPAAPAPRQICSASDAIGPVVLIVEDNPVMAQIIAKLLDHFPVRYAHVRNGIEAVEAAKEQDLALILMDILMPQLGGVRATKAIRELSPHNENIPIVAVTARVSERDIDEYLAEGMSGVVKKPINRINLAETLKTHLGIEERAAAPAEENAGIELTADDLDVLNWETIREYSALLKDRFKLFLKDYLVAGPDLLAAINEAIHKEEPGQVQFHAHKFKSTSQVFGAEAVSDLAARLEIMGKNDNLEQAEQVYQDLHVAYERAQRALRKKLVLLQNMG